MFKKLKNNDYNWTFQYIKEYNKMIAYYEKQLDEKNLKIKELEKEIDTMRSSNKFKSKQKQISDKDVNRIKRLKKEGNSYSYIAKETGWSKATISRVINNKNKIY